MKSGCKQPVILLADDDADDVLLIERALRRAHLDCAIECVRDGTQAIDYLNGENGFEDRSRFPLPDVLLSDIKMPKLDGLQVLQWVRHHRPFKKLPVVIMSSSNLLNDMQRAYQLGANQFFTKDRILHHTDELIAFLLNFVSW